ncbi:hypothetical protein BN1058_01587 [Paraliobacillus sp. PM-2]|uniref:YtxH domain-containing protein n=1 Tax=Paraliobacillus sp. PM-2 TaxID=1462524 RepID=UPI00061C8472|nr:YtxH domain-containing protein [Paraliobacillus sp. PM-2]CQR47279.1 hypothetical protein BN1058_01587 [Paraliobacillus sp. PM-2]
MKKNLLAKGIIVGAVVGGALTLFDPDTRMMVNQKLKKVNRKTTYFMHHPSDFIAEIRNQYQSVSTSIIRGFDTSVYFINEFQKIMDQTDIKGSND